MKNRIENSIILRSGLGIAIAVSLCFNIIPLVIPAEAMHRWYTSGSLILCLLGNAHIIIAFCYFCFRKEPYEDKAEKKQFERLAIWSFLNIFFGGVSLTGQIVRMFRTSHDEMIRDIIIILSTAVLFVTNICIFRAKSCVQPDERIWNKKEDKTL